MSIKAMKLALEALEDTKKLEHLQDYWLRKKALEALRIAIQQAEAQQPATGEPVGYLSEPISWGKRQSEAVVKITRKPQAEHGFTNPIYANPAPSVPDDVARDAERYRWLRDNGVLGFSGAPSWRVYVSFDAMDAYAQTLDSNIDAAMLAAK